MKTCEDHQLALEMRRHGALEAAEIPALETHLASCPECRAFEAQARAVNDLLRAAPAPGPSNLEAVRSQAARQERLVAYLPYAALGSFVGQGAILSWLLSPEAPLKYWGLFWIAGVIAAAGSALYSRIYRRRQHAALSQGVETWIAAQRKTLKERRDSWKYARFFGPVLCVGSTVLAIKATLEGDPRMPLLWGTSVLLGLGSLVMVRLYAAVERELRFFGEEVAT